MNLPITISETADLLAHQKVSPVELVQSCLDRIQKFDPLLHCFITLTPELALQQAYQAETEIRRGKYRGPLHGIPLALKDLYETAGIRTTAGSLFFNEYVPSADAFVVQKLKSAGAILIGKLNMHEIALGVTNENPHFGSCCNPWNPQYITGGSSGGSAAAVAAGLCLGSMGSDTGGSIRIPSSLCGVVGLKPTFGRISLRGVIPLSWNLDHAGPLSRSVRDAALLLQAVAGHDPDDPYSPAVPVDDYLRDLESGIHGWRVALAIGHYFTDPEVVESAVTDALQAVTRVFEQLGAHVDEALPWDLSSLSRSAAQANGLMTTSDAAAFHKQRLQEHPQGFGTDVLTRLQQGANYTTTEYSLARHTQVSLRRQFEKFFQEYDLLLTPTTPVTAPLRGRADAVERVRLLTRFTAPFNLVGLPAISLPCGLSKQGLPIGVQIIARSWAEASLLRAAHAFQQATTWHLLSPP